MSNELLEALNILEQEKNISKETLLEAIENSLVTACKNHFGKSDNVKVEIDPETCAFSCYQEKTVVDTVEDPVEEISLADAHKVNGNYQLGDIVISMDKVWEQAENYGHSREREYAFLIAHSMLHLFGYDHMEEEERKDMEKRQEEILTKTKYTRDERGLV